MSRFRMIKALPGFFKLVLHSLFHRSLRAALTTVGIVIGIAVVVGLVLLGNGLKASIRGQLEKFGSDVLIAVPQDITNPATSFIRSEFRTADVDEVRRVPGVTLVAPAIQGIGSKVEFGGDKKAGLVVAMDWNYMRAIFEKSMGVKMENGDWPASNAARQIVMGNSAVNLFKNRVLVGDSVMVLGHRFTVAGVFSQFGNRERDNAIFMSAESYQTVTGTRGVYKTMFIKVDPGSDLDKMSALVSAALKRPHGPEQFTVLTPEKAAQTVSDVIGMIQFILFLVAAVAVVVGGIGIMNTMYTSVLERTRQVGLMKAVGATRAQILELFVIESGLFGLGGGLIGTVGGAALAKYIAYLAQARGFSFFQVPVDAITVIWVLIFSVLIGAVAGMMPAAQAAKLKPAEALKYR